MAQFFIVVGELRGRPGGWRAARRRNRPDGVTATGRNTGCPRPCTRPNCCGNFRLDGLLGRDFHGRTVGVLGTGKIGSVFARIAKGFGMRLLGWDVAENPDCLEMGMSYVTKEQLFAEADLISLHLPLLPQTYHIVDATALAAMKDDALLIDSSRGGLVDTDALVATLREGRLAGVGLDVYEEEAGLFHLDKSLEVMTDDTLARLMTFRNVLVTSHQAYFTVDAVNQIIDTTMDNVRDFPAGRTSRNTLVPRAS